jgi:membrane-associated protein
MELLRAGLDFLLHLDKHLLEIIHNYGAGTYLILFAIVFCETGLVVTPFLPGDSLLFAAGAFAATGSLNLWLVIGLLAAAAVLGDSVNYGIGYLLRKRLADKGRLPLVKQKHLDKTHAFYEKYGAKTLVIARFVPIVRTFAPFVAGIGEMRYSKFMAYNVVGGIGWVLICTFAGYFFGNLPVVKENFSLVILGIIVISVLPAVIEIVRARRASGSAKS